MKKAFLLSALFMIIIFSNFVFAKSDIIGIGINGGYPFFPLSPAIQSNSVIYTDTEIANKSAITGGHITYIKDGWEFLGAEVSVRKYHVNLSVSGENYGTLEMMPVVLSLRGQGFKPKGWTGHGGLGIGFSLNKFNKTPHLLNLERNANDLDFDIKTSFVLDVGGGMDYFFTKRLSFNTDLHLLVNSPYVNNVYGDSNTYVNAMAFEIFSELTYWFGK